MYRYCFFIHNNILYLYRKFRFKLMIMKKSAFIIVLAFAFGLIISSCNREVCPAMSDVPGETEEVAPQA